MRSLFACAEFAGRFGHGHNIKHGVPALDLGSGLQHLRSSAISKHSGSRSPEVGVRSAMLPGMAAKPRVAIVGAGNLGSALAVALQRAGYAIEAVIARSRGASLRRAQKLAKQVGARAVARSVGCAGRVDLVLRAGRGNRAGGDGLLRRKSRLEGKSRFAFQRRAHQR